MPRTPVRRCVVGLVVAATTVSGCQAIPKRPAQHNPPPAYAAAAKRSDWAQYFWQPGKQCQLVLTTPVHKVGSVKESAQTTTTAQIVSTWPSSDGESYVVEENIRTVRTVGRAKPVTTMRKTRTLYTITKDGQIEVAPQSDQVGTMTVTFDDTQVYPSVASLRAGKPFYQTLHGTISSTDQKLANLFQEISTDGSGSVRTVSTERMVAHPATSAVVTPAGRYTDLFALDTSIVTFRAMNVPASVARAVESDFRSVEAPSTTWYARGVGPVWSTNDAEGVTSVEKLMRCGLAGAA